jgi:hypothetical protein
MTKRTLTTALDIAGAALLITGATMVSNVAGVITGGVLALVGSWRLSR